MERDELALTSDGQLDVMRRKLYVMSVDRSKHKINALRRNWAFAFASQFSGILGALKLRWHFSIRPRWQITEKLAEYVRCVVFENDCLTKKKS